MYEQFLAPLIFFWMATLNLALVFALDVIRRECGVGNLEIQSHDLEEPLIAFFDSSCPAEKETPLLFPYGMIPDSMESQRFTIKAAYMLLLSNVQVQSFCTQSVHRPVANA